ncbi:MAG TPA: arylesterase [Micropepsaceae bacterium]|nr:arylesterase [Micropepsaceae bacterium]
MFKRFHRSRKFIAGAIALAGIFVISAAESAPSSADSAAPVRILALGDSLTQGYGVPPGMDFPNRLERALKMKGLNVSVINAGVSGDTSAGGLARLDFALGDPKAVPDAAIVELGANDGLRGLPTAAMEKNLDAILAKLKARNIAALFSGMKAPRNFGGEYAAEYDAVFPKLAKKYGVLYDPFFLDGVILDRSLIQPDGLHPNPKGVDAIVARLTPLVTELVQQAKTKRTASNPAR